MIENYNIKLGDNNDDQRSTNIQDNKNEVSNHFVFLQNLYSELKTSVDIIKNDLNRLMTNNDHRSDTESIRDIKNYVIDVQKNLIQLSTVINKLDVESTKIQDYVNDFKITQPEILNEVKHSSIMIANHLDNATVHYREAAHLKEKIEELKAALVKIQPLTTLQTELEPISKFFKMATKPLGIIIILITLTLGLMATSKGLQTIAKMFKEEVVQKVEVKK